MPPKKGHIARKRKGQSGNPKGHRKDAVRSQLTEQLTPEALAGLEEQLAASVGMSGPPGGC